MQANSYCANDMLWPSNHPFNEMTHLLIESAICQMEGLHVSYSDFVQ
jgi:hypothetical protein